MFFCDACAGRRQWPRSAFKSYGHCEVCDSVTMCSDVPSKFLPMPTRKVIGREAVIVMPAVDWEVIELAIAADERYYLLDNAEVTIKDVLE